MEFSKEMIAKAKTAASADELIKLAAEAGIELTAEDAEKYFSFLTEGGELPDEALDSVAGGKDIGGAEAQFDIKDHVAFWYPPANVWTGGTITKMYPKDEWLYDIKITTNCNYVGYSLEKFPLDRPEYKACLWDEF